MNKKELEFILQKGEGQYIEFKESCDKSLAKEIVAFANAMGERISGKWEEVWEKIGECAGDWNEIKG